jgi:hypothetical protein
MLTAESALALAALLALCQGDREALVLLRRLVRRVRPTIVRQVDAAGNRLQIKSKNTPAPRLSRGDLPFGRIEKDRDRSSSGDRPGDQELVGAEAGRREHRLSVEASAATRTGRKRLPTGSPPPPGRSLLDSRTPEEVSVRILYLATSGSNDPTKASIPLHIAANGSIEAGQECAVVLAGEATELVSQETADRLEGVGVPPARELLAKLFDNAVPVYV